MITISPLALTKVIEMATSESIDLMKEGLRLRVIGGGCAGFSHDMYFEDKWSEMDEIIQHGDVKLIVDPLSYQYLEGTTIDYVENLYGSGFKFLNPNIKSTCGCGSSFSV